jgi:histidine triad (HIT) family protein
MRLRTVFFLFLGVVLGLALGWWFFRDVQDRQIVALDRCASGCFDQRQLLGLLGAVGIKAVDDVMPYVEYETDRTVVMRHPFPYATIHYVIIPKRDIKNIGDVHEGDAEYLTDALTVASHLIRDKGIAKYRLITNGPGFQSVDYLHFHLFGTGK